MLRCPAKLQSVVAKFSGQIFTKIKFLILFSLRSFLLPLHSFFLKFPLNCQCRDKSSCTWGWFQNGLVISKTWQFLNILEPIIWTLLCCTFNKSSDLKNIINPMKSFTQFGCAQLRRLKYRGESDNFDFSLTSESTYYSMKI